MERFVITPKKKNSCAVFAAAKRMLAYLINYKHNMKDLQEQVALLLSKREDILGRTVGARRDGDVISIEVERWLAKVSEAIDQAKAFYEEARLEEVKFCNSPFLRCRLSIRAMDMASRATELLGSIDRLPFIRRPISSIMTRRDYGDFGSRTRIFHEMMEALYDDNINVIGVYGMVGVGKTTLVSQVASLAIEDGLFDKEVLVHVSGNPNVSDMQQQIADKLGFSISEESEVERAALVYWRLKQEKKVLIILDDVWEHLDLEKIGIPSTNDHVKIVVVGTSLNVLRQMGAQKSFKINPLLQDEAFSLFLKLSGINDDADPRYRELAVQISNHCQGLPFLIFTVAIALQGQELDVWKHALCRLKLFRFGEFEPLIITETRRSIDSLESDELKLTLLLCAALGKEIFIDQLVVLSLAWGLFEHHETVEDTRRKIISGIQSLQNSCLLLDDGKLIVHDLVREAALQIASNTYNIFVLQYLEGKMSSFGGEMWPDNEDHIQNTTAIFLHGKHERELPERLVCPRLELFHAYDESRTLKFPDNFFEQINRGLKVLSLNNIKLPSLPSSICVLTSIQTLCLDKCELQDIALLGKLITLKVLSLSSSNIEQLPHEIRDLVNLWLLDLDNCSKLKRIPPTVISNLTRLQELLLPNSFSHWQHSEGSNDERTDVSLGELSQLNDMKALQIHIPDIKAVLRDFPWNKLERYNISIGQEQEQWSGKFERKLQLKLSTSIHAYDWVKLLLVKSEELWLKELKGFESLLELDHEGFQKLKHLHIQDIAEMEWLANSKYANLFPTLELLALHNLIELRRLCRTQPSIGISFVELRVVKVECCDKLEFIFSFSLYKNLRKLEEMEISTCRNLGAIFGENKLDEASGTVGEYLIEFPNLRTMTLQNLAELVGVVEKKTNINSSIIFDEKVVFTKLEKLDIRGLHRLTIIFNHQVLGLQRLSYLALFDCDNLKYLFSSQVAEGFPYLQELRINACKSIEEIVVAESGTSTNKIAFPKMKTLILENLAKLRSFCWDGSIVEWQSLKVLRVVKCPNITQYALGSVDKSNLQVEVKECPWHKEYDPHSSTAYLFLPSDPSESQPILDIKTSDELGRLLTDLKPFSFRKLTELSASKCNETLSNFLSILILRSHELQHLEVKQCKSLTEIFKLQNLVADLSGEGKYFSQLKTVKLQDLPNLSCIWNKDPTGILGLHNLEEMEIVNCGLLKTIVPTSLAQYLRQLKELKIHSCPTVESVAMKLKEESRRVRVPIGGQVKIRNIKRFIAGPEIGIPKSIIAGPEIRIPTGIIAAPVVSQKVSEKREIVLPKLQRLLELKLPELQTLELVFLPMLKRFHPPDYIFQFPAMQSLVIEDCPTMDAFTSGFLNAQSLPAIEGKPKEELQGEKVEYPKLKNLKLKGLQNIKEIWQGWFSPGSFSELKEVEVIAFGKLKYLIPFNMLPALKALEKLSVKNCELITEVFQIAEEFELVSSVFSKPSTLILVGLPNLLHIIKNESVGSKIFENLQSLQVKRCDSLQNLAFPSNCLQTLTKLEISECRDMEKFIIIKEGHIVEKMLFTCLVSFVLENLPKLSSFSEEAFEFSSVEKISIINCPKLETFPAGPSKKDNFSTINNDSLTNKVSFEKLQKLHLANLDRLDFRLEAWNKTMSPKSLYELRELELGQSSESFKIIPSILLNRMQKLKKCTLRQCEMLELAFEIDDGNHQSEELLPRLEELVLTDLPRLVLLVQEPKIPAFKNLGFLELVRCSSLKTLFSIKFSKNLEQLELLKLYDCEKMEHVLEGAAGSAQLMEFKKLKRLILKHLPSLMSFCKGDCDFKLPELEIVRVKDIPKMEMFAKGNHQTPKLKEFYITYVSNCWQGELNKTIKYLHENPGAEHAGHKILKATAEEPSIEAKNTGAVAKGKQKVVE